MEKSTEDLQSELTQAQSYDEFYNKNTSEIKFPSAVDYLNYLLDLKGITNKADFVKKTNLERTYVYHKSGARQTYYFGTCRSSQYYRNAKFAKIRWRTAALCTRQTRRTYFLRY